MSALPIRMGPFGLAKLYDREPAVTSRAIPVATILPIVTLSLSVACVGRM